MKERVSTRVEEVRRRRPFIDHIIRMVQHYGAVKGTHQAAAVTYFGFLSFFPIMALAFFAVGQVSKVFPDAEEDLYEAIRTVLPGMIGTGEGQLSLADIQAAAGTVGLIGFFGVLYSGLGWLSGMRNALLVVFELPEQEQPNFLLGKARDLISLILIGVILLMSVAVAGFVQSFSEQTLEFVGLGAQLSPLLKAITYAVALATNMLLFFTLFVLLAHPNTPRRSLWSGALLGAVGFEVLKYAAGFLMGAVRSQPAFQAFGIALILLVWINYFSRVVMFAASWAHTSKAARRLRDREQAEEAERIAATRVDLRKTPPRQEVGPGARVRSFAAGGATALALVVAVLRNKREDG